MSGSGIGGTYFNPLPPHGGRRHGDHTPGRTGRKFQSTPSAWRETFCSIMAFRTFFISIHSLRMEGDREFLLSYSQYCHFNPLPPHGGRQEIVCKSCVCAIYFNPLPPHGGRLCVNPSPVQEVTISIHSLRMEGDALCCSGLPFCGISIHSLRMEGD